MRVLAIDQGTSATKAIVVVDGVAAAEAEFPCPPTATHDGAVEVSPELLWNSVVAAGRAAIDAAGGTAPDVIGLANQGETIVAWDRHTGVAMSTAIVWQDRRSADICEDLRAAGWASRLTEITGLELDPYFVAPKVRWLRERVGQGPVITTSDVWLLNRMCGAFVTDAATASRTLLLDLDSVTWSTEACSAFGIGVDELPTIVDNSGPVGETTAFSDTPIPITGLCVDQQAALFAESCRAAGEAKCTYGTGAFLLTSTGHEPRRSANGLVGCVAWRQGGETTWCLDGQVYTVGSVVSWLQDIGLISQPADLDAIGSTTADTGGVAFVPGLAGLGAPFWRANAKGALIGLSLGTTRAHIVRSVIEGIAAQVAWLARAAEADLGSSLTALRVDGGLTRSQTLMQVQADLLQAPVEVYPSSNATALGVGAFAQIGAGVADDAALWSPSAVFEPRVGRDEAEVRLKAWRTVVEATSPFDA